jgi:DNA-binding XRE family transcriptional regulator
MAGYYERPPEQRFWARAHPDPNTGCWHWSGSLRDYRFGREYPIFMVDRKTVSVHRWSYEHFNGPIPEGMFVLHSCDNPLCVSPDHLRVGTHDDNMGDKVKRQRQVRGERVHTNVLTEDEVRVIRAVTDMSQQELADLYDVARTTISAIQRGVNWKHLS